MSKNGNQTHTDGAGALHPSRVALPYVRQWIAAQEAAADATAAAAVAAAMKGRAKGKLAEHYEEQFTTATQRAEDAEAQLATIRACVADEGAELERWFGLVLDGWRRAEDQRATAEFGAQD